jgi:molybdenum cofactor cytidylyltransferase
VDAVLTLALALRLAGREPGGQAVPAPTVAFAGAGGKTTAIFTLARQLRPTVVSATTHLGAWQASLADVHVVWAGRRGPWEALESALGRDVTLITGPPDASTTRLTGLSSAQVGDVAAWARDRSRALLIEADGSRGLPLKAPAAHEPALPPCANVVVVTAGLTGLGMPLDAAHVHRAEAFSQLSGCPIGAPVTARALAAVLAHADGGLRHVPPSARRVVLLNQADTAVLLDRGADLVPLLRPAFHAIALASHRPVDFVAATLPEEAGAPSVVSVHEPVAGVVLAGGDSSRYGAPKALLDFGGRPFVRAVVEATLAAGLSPVVVVIGAGGERVSAAVADMPVRVVHNSAWASGQSTSVRAGLSGLSPDPGAAVFLMCDQPHVSPDTLRALVGRHAQGLFPIVATTVSGRRVSPVLFDRSTFGDFERLTGDSGGRTLFEKYTVEAVACPDDRLLLDVDTPEDYQRLLGLSRPGA